MKITCVALMLVCAALTQATASADDATPHAIGSVNKDKSGDRHVAQPNRSATRARPAVTSHVKPPSNNRAGAVSSNTALRRTIGPFTAPARNNMLHRGFNPAVVGGAASSNARNTGALNGTRMNRRQH